MKEISEYDKIETAFFLQLDLSEKTIKNYRGALNSSFFSYYLKVNYGCTSLFELTDLKVLWKLYSKLNVHPKNISNHRCYSSVVNRYIRFLNGGEKYGKRVDYGKRKAISHKKSI